MTVEQSKVRLIGRRSRSCTIRHLRPLRAGGRVALAHFAARGVAFEDQDTSRTTGYIDWRWYRTLFWGMRCHALSAAASVGRPRIFFVEGLIERHRL
jgi:hypothetical protein